jgi:hypothetical protein
LKGHHREEGRKCLSRVKRNADVAIAVRAYAEAIRLTFVSAIGFFVVVNLLIIPVKLPWLGKDRVAADVDEEDIENENGDSRNL